jgi:hypothetical protein
MNQKYQISFSIIIQMIIPTCVMVFWDTMGLFNRKFTFVSSFDFLIVTQFYVIQHFYSVAFLIGLFCWFLL